MLIAGSADFFELALNLKVTSNDQLDDFKDMASAIIFSILSVMKNFVSPLDRVDIMIMEF